MPPAIHARVLLVSPRFASHSFWNYQATCAVVGKRYSAAPLGLVTVAALLPEAWELRLVDRNIEELTDADIDWADLVMTGGMLPQQQDILAIIDRAQIRGKPIAVGGTDVTSSPHRYAQADFRILGEAEEVMAEFVAAWTEGARHGRFQAARFPDLADSPVPRFDLLKLDRYMHVGLQISRGCPFNCEFCNVIELNGRVPRVKAPERVIAELDALYALGYRGHVDFVDDNLIGNRQAVRPILREIARWVRARGYPFEFSTEASLNLAADEELLALMREANFFAIFVGIETPDKAALSGAHKRQNVGRDITSSVRTFYSAGLFVNAGFIVGFDAEQASVAEAMVQCIEEAAIPVCMVGLLYALPNTQLAKRLLAESRLHAGHDMTHSDQVADQCSSGLNFETLRPRDEVLEDYRAVIERIYEPEAFFGRVRRQIRALDIRGHRLRRPLVEVARDLRSFARINRWMLANRGVRGPYLRALGDALLRHPRAVRIMVSMAALYMHYQPYARDLVTSITGRIAVAQAGGPQALEGATPLPAGARPAREGVPAAAGCPAALGERAVV